MAIRVEETFRVQAPVERVWAYLIDPRRVVDCLPGAELLDEGADRTYTGRVKQKLGPVSATFKGKAQLVEVDEASRRMRMSASGTDAAGNGSAKMTMTGQLTPRDGATEVHVVAEIDLVGKLMQFGRGMVGEVSRELVKQFAACMQQTLAADAPAASDAAARASAKSSPAAAMRSETSMLPILFRALMRTAGRLFRGGREKRLAADERR
jgi:carbon monoxide dehydrogenase subunit G